MATTELHALRSELNALIEAAAADLEQREQSLAAAAEQLSQDAAVQAAWRQGSAAMQGHVVALIDRQLDALRSGGVNATCLATLRRMVMEIPF
jgi:fatty acid/phospholipid biosynthesis enzyme